MAEIFESISSAIDGIISVIMSGNRNTVLHIEGSHNARSLVRHLCKEPSEGINNVLCAHLDRQSFLYTPSMKPYSIDTMLKYSLTEHLILADAENKSCDAKNYISELENSLTEDTLLIIDGYDVASPSPYLRHLFTLDCFILVITDKRMDNVGDCALYFECNFPPSPLPSLDLLDREQKELLLTLCAFLSHLDSSAEIISSGKGVFDTESARLYLGNPADGIFHLCDLGFAEIESNGSIYIDRDIQRYVLSQLSPDAESCPSFFEFCKNAADFRIIHSSKDTDAVLHVDKNESLPITASGELLCLYCRFLQSDPDGIPRLYNMLMSYVLENLSMQKGTYFSRHLLMKNAPYLISVLSESIYGYLDIIYEDADTDEIPADICADLDIIRICICFMRNMTPDMYKRSRAIFDCLQGAFEKLICFGKNTVFEAEDRLLVLDSALELCHETFGFFGITDISGIFNASRADFENRRVSYVCEGYTDMLFGDSLVFGYNMQTVLLYSKYCRLLEMWLMLHSGAVPSDMPLLRQLDCDKRDMRKNKCNMIKSHYQRLARGLDVYTDVLNERYFTDDIYSCENNADFEKRLNDNIHLSKRGYDRGTLSGAERYCKSVISELERSECPAEAIIPVLSPRYPVSREFYGILSQKDILSLLTESKNTTNRAFEILLESLVFMYPDCTAESELCSLYRELICGLWERVSKSRSFLERMYIYTSRMYVRYFLDGSLSEFEDKLYEYICRDSGILPTYCDGYIAKAIYNKRHAQRLPFIKSKISAAIGIFEKENPSLSGCGKTLTEYISG